MHMGRKPHWEETLLLLVQPFMLTRAREIRQENYCQCTGNHGSGTFNDKKPSKEQRHSYSSALFRPHFSGNSNANLPPAFQAPFAVQSTQDACGENAAETISNCVPTVYDCYSDCDF